MRILNTRKTRRRLVFVATLFAFMLGSATSASAEGYCVDAYPQSGYGATACIPWGG